MSRAELLVYGVDLLVYGLCEPDVGDGCGVLAEQLDLRAQHAHVRLLRLL